MGSIYKLNLYICIGYILPTIEEYMLVEFIYWYWIYSANILEIYVSWIYILLFDIFCQQLGEICQLKRVGLQNILFKENTHSSKCTICNPAPTPHNWHISPNCWQNISNTRIYPIPLYKFNWHIFPNYIQYKLIGPPPLLHRYGLFPKP